MNNKLAITGPFADVNFGDYAMLINNLALMPLSEIAVFTYDINFSSKLISDYSQDYKVEICTVMICEEKAKHIDSNSMPHDIIAAVTNFEEVLSSIQQMGKLLVNGGGYFNSLWFKPHRRARLCQIMAPALIAAAYGIPVVFSGNGYGPFEEEDRPFFERVFAFLKEADFGSRDSFLSPVWAASVGIEYSRMTHIPDDLFPVAECLLKEECSFAMPNKDYCVLETYYSNEYLESHKSYFLSFFRYVQEELNLKIVLLPFHLGDGGLAQSKLLKSWDSRVELVDISDKGYLPIADAVSIISNAKFMISSRYHALVFAVQVRTPIFSVMRDVLNSKAYYFNKNYGFLETALGRNFEPNLFLYDCFISAFEKIESSLPAVLNDQNRLFDLFLDESIIEARRSRKNFFEKRVLEL